MELNVAAEKSSAARVYRAALFFEVDPQECGGLRQGDIALIHSAPTGEKGGRSSLRAKRSNPKLRQ